MTQWIWAHLAIIISIAVVVSIVILAFSALLQWLSSRGKFMFLDGVLRDRGAVVEPWRQFKELGNNLFIFRFLFGLAVFVLVVAVLVVGLFLAWQDIRYEQFGGGAVAALVVIGLILVPTVIIAGVVSLLLEDMVVPIMYRRGIHTVPAFRVLVHEILPGNILSFILFYLMRILIGLVFAIITMVGCCLTCCIAALPYISSVVFLPLLVFSRSYSVYFLQQVGPEWTFFGEGAAAEPEAEIV